MGTQIGKLIVDSRHNIGIDSLNGRIVAFDAYNTVYAFLARIRDKSSGGNYFTDSEGHVTSHLMGLFPRLTYFLERGLKPVFILDGKPPLFKLDEIKTRKKVKQEAEIRREDAIARGEMEEAMKYAQATSRITPDILEDTKTLIKLFGIPIIQAPSEAEAQGALMTSQGLIHAMASQDYDSFLFGCPNVIRNLGISQRRKVPNQQRFIDVPTEQIVLNELLSELKLKNRTQLILLGLLVGTDYNPKGIKGIGPKTALKLVHQYPTINSLLDYLESKYSLSEIFPFPPETLLDYFLNPEVEDESDLVFSNPQPKALQDFLVDDREFQLSRVQRSIKTLQRLSKQNTLDQFF
jgi:flap endonuclease-1